MRTPQSDPLNRYRRRWWPPSCFPSYMTEHDRYRFVLWHFLRAAGRRMRADQAEFRPPVLMRLAVRARWCWQALRTTWRLFRLMLILDGSWPSRAALTRLLRRPR